MPRRSSATRVQHYHTHLPAAQTRSLDWNDRIKKKKKPPLQPKPPLHRMPPRIYANKNFYSWNPGAISCNRRTSGEKSCTGCGFYSILQTCSDKTHTVNKKKWKQTFNFYFLYFYFFGRCKLLLSRHLFLSESSKQKFSKCTDRHIRKA